MAVTVVQRICRSAWVCLALLTALVSPPAGAQTFTRAPMWQHEILPVLEEHCVRCHGGDQTMAELDLTKFESVLKGGVSGPPITPGHPEMSMLWSMIESDEMPVGGELSAANKQLIKAWIQNGRFPSKDKLDGDRRAAMITPEARQFWSFKKPIKSPVPPVKNADQVITPDRCLRTRQVGGKGLETATGGGSPHPDSTRLFRPDRVAAHARRSKGVHGR